MRRPLMIAAALLVTLAGIAGAQRAQAAVSHRPHCSTDGTTQQQFLSAACKALSGDFGPLRPWQRAAYQRGLAHARTVTVWQTIYGPWEGYDRGEGCRWGYGCSEAIAAANALPGGTVVWVAHPAHLRVIGDTGASGNDRVARHKGGRWWLDLWVPRRGWRGVQESGLANVVVIGKVR